MRKIVIELSNGIKMVSQVQEACVGKLINEWHNLDNVVFISVQRYPLYKNDAIIIKDTKNGKDELNGRSESDSE